MPREYYLRRAVECYERACEPRAAAEVLAEYGTPATSIEAARRFADLGDLAAAGEAYLAARQLRVALDCFRRAGLAEQELVCLQALGDDAQAGALLLELGRLDEARGPLEQALAAARDVAVQAALHLHLARALATGEPDAAQAHYHAALALLPKLPATEASAEAWVALGVWGQVVGRQDRMQEGYAQALRLLKQARDGDHWREVALRYRDAARACGNRRLVQMLDVQIAERIEAVALAAPPDPARALLEAGKWETALELLEPRARAGEEVAKRLLVELIEGDGRPAPSSGVGSGVRTAPLPLRLKAAEILGAAGDPRLLELHTGSSAVGNYWCQIEAGPFWFGDDRHEELQQVRLPYAYRIGRYPVTNAEYGRFVEAGGYAERRWWTENGWQVKGSRTEPSYWGNEQYNQPPQPVVGVSWYEAAAYSAWLTAQGQRAGWLGADAELRLPTSLEWERAARHTDQRRYPWGDAEPDGERANYQETGIAVPTPVGCFPAGAAACGAQDMAGNVMEWLATTAEAPQAWEPRKDVTSGEGVLLSYSGFYDKKEDLCCGARFRSVASNRNDFRGFRVVWSLALTE